MRRGLSLVRCVDSMEWKNFETWEKDFRAKGSSLRWFRIMKRSSFARRSKKLTLEDSILTESFKTIFFELRTMIGYVVKE